MTSLLASAPPQAGTEILERILAAPAGLVVLESGDSQALIANFRAIARHSGQAIYLWQPDSGLGNLREAHARVPGCQRLGSALRYMQQSMHFGVYLLLGLEPPLSAMDHTLLRQLARPTTGHLRRVVLLDAPAALIEQLGDLALHLQGSASAPQRPRLRDGRWVT